MNRDIPRLKETPNDDVELLSIAAASKLIHVDVLKLRHAMNQWAKSSGRMGLAFVQVGSRQKLRRASLRKWLEKLEELTMLGYV